MNACQSPLALTTCRLAWGMAKPSMTAKRTTKGTISQAQSLDDGRISKEGQHALNQHGDDDEDHLGRAARQVSGL